MALMLEKVKFSEDAIYELPSNAVHQNGDVLTITFALPTEGAKTYEEIEKQVSNKDRIDILDSSGEVMLSYKGFIYLSSLEKKFDYVIGQEVDPDATDLEGETTYKDVTATVMVVSLKRSDFRTQVNDIQSTVDLLVIESLA